MAVSSDPNVTLVTYSLGSCLGVTAYDPALKIGGMVHCMLPLSRADKAKAQANPLMFVDSGVGQLLTKLFEMGVDKNRLEIKAAGASCILDSKGVFKIGERNYTVFRKVLWKNKLMIAAEDVGGNKSRTVRLELATGRVTINSKGNTVEL